MSMIELIMPSLLMGVMLALISGPLGSFVVWGKMSYFGDTLAHASLLGMTLGLLLNIDPIIGVIAITVLVALLLAASQQQNRLASDTVLGIIAHGTLATGLVIASQMSSLRIDLMAFLFGDLLAVTWADVRWVFIACLLLSGGLYYFWNSLLNTLVNDEIAIAEGIPVQRMRVLLLLMLAILVAIGMKVVGALLITAIMIIPAASARRLAKNPEQMALLASIIGAIAVACGLLLSFLADTPTGPSIVICTCLLFTICLLKKPHH